MLAVLLCTSAAGAQALRHLYASQPPAGSTFIRVVNPDQASARVGVAGAPPVPIAGAATPYEIVKGGTSPAITVDGQSIAIVQAPPADAFMSYLLRRNASGITAVPVTDAVDQALGLKAELRFYNLVSGCTGRLDLVGGPAIFDAVPSYDTRRRSINPVEASVTATCGTIASEPLKLPSLKPADHFSVFLTGTADKPIIVGQIDETEMSRESAR